MNTHVLITSAAAQASRRRGGESRHDTAANGNDPADFQWPRLQQLTLSPERLDARNSGIGGSDANIILSGDKERLLRLWREKRRESPRENLSGEPLPLPDGEVGVLHGKLRERRGLAADERRVERGHLAHHQPD